jgi:hypothetical protein
MVGGKAKHKGRMELARPWEPAFGQGMHSVPGDAVRLASTDQSPPPEPDHSFAKYPQAVHVPRYRVVVEVALDHRLEPLAGLRNGIVHSLTKLLLDAPQSRPHALADRLAPYLEVPVPAFPADVRETQKVERFRLTFPSLFPALFGIPPELDPAFYPG